MNLFQVVVLQNEDKYFIVGFPNWHVSGCHFQEQVCWGTWLQPPPLTPSGPPTHFSPRTSNTRLDSIFVEGILNLRPRHSIRPHIKQTIWGQMDFPHIVVKLSLCCGFQHFWNTMIYVDICWNCFSWLRCWPFKCHCSTESLERVTPLYSGILNVNLCKAELPPSVINLLR